jgi:UDP-N-acetylmuramyl pentapeptide phosphotransferase/UDP-N-acetylglucosamine-1-phosphate transferase
MQDSLTTFVTLAIVLVATVLSALLIVAFGPWLARYAVAEPNARSSQKSPTPQGGGIAVIAATILVSGTALFVLGAASANVSRLIGVLLGVLLIAGVGVIADKHPIGPAPRLVLQSFAVIAVLASLPADMQLLPFLPLWSERILLLIGGLWFVNIVNFMDGLDWMTVVEVVPITATMGALGLLGILPWQDTIISLALCGATIGFAFFNRPVANFFLGTSAVFLSACCWAASLLCLLARGGTPLQYCCLCIILATVCAGLQITNRFGRRTGHIFTSAPPIGFHVTDVVTRVGALNLALVALALMTVLLPSRVIETGALIAGALLTAGLLVVFARGPKHT